MGTGCLNGTSSSDRVLEDDKKRENVNSHMVQSNKERKEEQVSERLTDVVVFPNVAHGHVASQQHSDSANTALLHIDVLVVVSVTAWNTRTTVWRCF